MPRLSDTMTEGVIAAWHVKVGDTVASGDLLAEVETDKATMDVESYHDGMVLHIGVDEGSAIPVGQLLVVIGEQGEDISSILSGAETPKAAAPAAPVASEETPAPVAEAPQPVAPSQPTPAPQAVPAMAVSTATDGRIKASPLAKAMAKDRGIDLTQVNGSGDQGRIIKRDIENFVPAPVVAPATQAAPIPAFAPVIGEESFEEETVSQMRKTIARRLGESKFSAPHFYLTMEINMGKAVAARKSMNEIAPVKISFNDIVIRAVAAALRKHPRINASWLGDKIRINHHIHVGMAVAVKEGLLVPVIRFADQKSLSQISVEAKDLAGKARERKLQPKDWEGNTFTVSNLGMFGIEEFTAIINPPDACILAVGGIIDKAIVKDGQIVPGKMMKVTLSCDHRVVDGAMGSEFLVTLKQLLEDPVRILI